MGLFDWLVGPKVAQISVQEAHDLLKGKNPPLIVDVRQPEETKAGTVAKAVLIPLPELDQRLAELPRERPILTICRSGNRSQTAAKKLAKAGYEVQNVAGGMMAWESARLPVRVSKRR